MVKIKKHFRSKQDFHLELSPIENLNSFMSGPTVAKETLVFHTDDTSSIGTAATHYIDDTSSMGTQRVNTTSARPGLN